MAMYNFVYLEVGSTIGQILYFEATIYWNIKMIVLAQWDLLLSLWRWAFSILGLDSLEKYNYVFNLYISFNLVILHCWCYLH